MTVLRNFQQHFNIFCDKFNNLLDDKSEISVSLNNCPLEINDILFCKLNDNSIRIVYSQNSVDLSREDTINIINNYTLRSVDQCMLRKFLFIMVSSTIYCNISEINTHINDVRQCQNLDILIESVFPNHYCRYNVPKKSIFPRNLLIAMTKTILTCGFIIFYWENKIDKRDKYVKITTEKFWHSQI